MRRVSVTPAQKRGEVACPLPTIPNIADYEPVSAGLIGDAVWFLQHPDRQYRVRAVTPLEGAAFLLLEAEQRGDPEVLIKRPMWGKIVCRRTDGLKISRRATSCSRQEARAIGKRYADEASARRMFGDPRLRHTDSFDGVGVLGALKSEGGMQ